MAIDNKAKVPSHKDNKRCNYIVDNIWSTSPNKWATLTGTSYNCLKIEKLKAQKLTIHFEKSFGSIPGSMALRMGRRWLGPSGYSLLLVSRLLETETIQLTVATSWWGSISVSRAVYVLQVANWEYMNKKLSTWTDVPTIAESFFSQVDCFRHTMCVVLSFCLQERLC